VGKTAIAEGIAQVLATALIEEAASQGLELPKVDFSFRNPFAKKDVTTTEKEVIEEDPYVLPKCPKNLAGARLISIDLASLVAGTANRGDFEKRVQNLIREASTSNVILFIDELHQIVSTGGDGAMNAANLFKPALSRGEMRVLGATTIPEYRRYIEKDGALERRFQPIQVKEPSVDETIQILAAVVSKYEQFHGVKYTNNALVSAARLSDRYISDRFLPDKAIDIIDEAGSMSAMQKPDDEEVFVDEDGIADIVAKLTGIPVGKLDRGERERLQKMEETLKKRIKGQDLAVRSIVKALRRARTGMRDGRRPVSSFMFCGPTGKLLIPQSRTLSKGRLLKVSARRKCVKF
jgi:ATP-dependent Clp protease ATP-binding subunit ClpC